ncbi:MAG: TolC family protein [Sphingobacteriales bacterium]|nr:MAG: TolC family protein [Sphingobacteriales bacterium]
MRPSTKNIVALSIAVLSMANVFAEPRKLSLDEAIQLSLQNSNQLKLNRAKIDEATASLREARERRLPDLSVTGSYLRMNQPTLDLKLKLGSSSSGEGGSGSTGGTTTASTTPKVDQAMYAMASLSVPLFAGFKISNGIEAAKYLENAEKLDAEQNREEVIQNTISAYSNMYKAKAALDIVKENLRQSQQRVSDFSSLEQNGLMARNDLLKAQLQQSNVELALVDAENNWKITYIYMNLMLGLPEEAELMPDSAAFNTTADVGTFESWESKALESRKDMSALEMRIKAAHSGVKAAKGDYYPSLALTGGYIAADIPNLLTVTNVINGGVGVKYSPSSLWKTGSKVAQAKARVQQLDVNRNMLSDGIRLETAQAYQAYLSNQKKIEVYGKAVEQANENYRITKNKYDNSLSTTTDLLDADVAQLQAKLNYAFAKADAVVSYNKLLETTGTLSNNNK